MLMKWQIVKAMLLKVESVAALEEIISDPDSMRMQVASLINVNISCEHIIEHIMWTYYVNI